MIFRPPVQGVANAVGIEHGEEINAAKLGQVAEVDPEDTAAAGVELAVFVEKAGQYRRCHSIVCRLSAEV